MCIRDRLEIAREAEYEADAWDESEESDEPAGRGILYLLEDMRELELYGSVCAVVSVCDSMNYILEEADLREVFSRVHELSLIHILP